MDSLSDGWSEKMTEPTDADHPLDADQAAQALEARLGPGVLVPLSQRPAAKMVTVRMNGRRNTQAPIVQALV